MAQVVEEVRTSYQQLIAPRKLKMELKDIPPIYGDRSRLTQVVENLLTNAVKFTPATGSITLGLSAHGRSGELTVSDTGMGIPLKEQRRLFEKFFQPKVPSSLKMRGTGLGLAIVKEIVQMHGGTIRVASQPNHGTTFTVSMPLYTPQFALTEEFRLMREQAAREGTSLVCQLLWAKPIASVSWEEISRILEKHVSREDKVLVNPEGGLVLLSVSDPEGFQAMRRRLEEVLRFHPETVASSTLRWGWAFVPQDGTQLSETLALAKRKGEEKR
jgi:anti-sigma regulatory factor (Ser/Thr protein kinase)